MQYEHMEKETRCTKLIADKGIRQMRTSSFISNLREVDSLTKEQMRPTELSHENTWQRNLLIAYSSTPSL